MKKYFSRYWGAGFQYEPARKLCDAFISEMQKDYTTFTIESFAVEPARSDLQAITLFYSIDEVELKYLETKKKIDDIEPYQEMIERFHLLLGKNKIRISQKSLNYIYFGEKKEKENV